MPTRSLRSPVLRWPDRDEVMSAVDGWARRLVSTAPVVAVGVFGSYLRGDWGVGSDVDLVVIVSNADAPFWARSLDYDATGLPVPADVLVYTEDEWAAMEREGRGPARERVEWIAARAGRWPISGGPV